MQFFGRSRGKTPFTPLHAPPSSPASTPSPAEGQIGSLSFSQRCSHSVAPPKASGRGGAPVPGGAQSIRPSYLAVPRPPLLRAPRPWPRTAPPAHPSARRGLGLGRLSCGSNFRAYKSASSSPILLSSPAPGSPCNHSKTAGAESKPRAPVQPLGEGARQPRSEDDVGFALPGLGREEVPERGAAPRSAGVGVMGLALAPMRLLGKRTLLAPWCPGTSRARRICLFV